MEPLAEYVTPHDAAQRLVELAAAMGSTEVAIVRNLALVPAPRELYLLAPPAPLPVPAIAAFAVDMDGTSTTTEPLALHALEYMVRRITGRMERAAWPGLDAQRDIPFVIGNSNFRHTEFLLQRYHDALNSAAFSTSVIEAWVWTLVTMNDRQRLAEVRRNAVNCGVAALLDDEELRTACAAPPAPGACAVLMARLAQRHAGAFRPPHAGTEVAAALDVYYHRYHELLHEIEQGRGAALADELLGGGGKHLIAPMPGYGVFLCLIKGWLSDEAAAALAPLLRAVHPHDTAARDGDQAVLQRLARQFRGQPAKLALVTASIAYEAHVSMQEVMRVVREEIAAWPVAPAVRDALRENLRDYRAVFDGFATASDAWEARLKPHRDLYSLSLYQMSIPAACYQHCMAIEDTEPGIVSARAAGFGISIALPNHDTTRQNYTKASRVLHGGLPELLLDHTLFLNL